jgi:hypothetical protein
MNIIRHFLISLSDFTSGEVVKSPVPIYVRGNGEGGKDIGRRIIWGMANQKVVCECRSPVSDAG